MLGRWLQKLDRITPLQGWLMVAGSFAMIATLDIVAPPPYILAYWYMIPLLISLSVLPWQSTLLVLLLSVLATLSDLLLPTPLKEWSIPFIVISRLIVIFFMVATVLFFFYRNRHKNQLQEREKKLSEAYHLAQLREDFIAALSHDLKTPLLGGQKVLQYFVDGTFGPIHPEQTAALETLLRGNALELELIETLLTIYKNDHRGVITQLEWTEMPPLVEDILSQCRYLGLEQQIELRYHADAHCLPTYLDPLQIRRVMLNLLHNALNYAPPQSAIEVTLSHQDTHLRISVQDHGPGFQPEELKNIFLRFYQGAHGQRSLLGSGLGLYLARQIVQAHGGSIWAENIEPHGCQIHWTLPYPIQSPQDAQDPDRMEALA